MRGDGRRGERGDGSICVVLMRESKTERKWEGESASVYLSHLSLSSSSVFGVIWSSQPVSSRPGTPCSLCARVCVCYVYMYTCLWMEEYTVKGESVKRSFQTSQGWRYRQTSLQAHMHTHTRKDVHTRKRWSSELWWLVLGVEWGVVTPSKSSFNRLFTEMVQKNTHPYTQTPPTQFTRTRTCTHTCILNPRSIWVSFKCSCVCLSSTHGKHIRDTERENTACWIWLPQNVQNKHFVTHTNTHCSFWTQFKHKFRRFV